MNSRGKPPTVLQVVLVLLAIGFAMRFLFPDVTGDDIDRQQQWIRK